MYNVNGANLNVVSDMDSIGDSTQQLRNAFKRAKIDDNSPVCILVLGMAGSGKTSFVRQFSTLKIDGTIPYVVNLDPACHDLPYNANIDIRDTVNYKDVMKHYKLGPNGGIVTSLNLFATKFGDVIDLIRQKDHDTLKYVIIDTPGQIEVFNWSVSGTIITDGLASIFPTVVVYVMDTARSTTPSTFMSNMLYACSIMYKTRLPFIVVMNKTDVVDNAYAVDWMQNVNSYTDALDDTDDQSYMPSLLRRMSLVLDDFYKDLKVCGVSSITGDGFDRFLELLKSAKVEYDEVYRAEFKNLAEKRLFEKVAGGKSEDDNGISLQLPGYESSEDEEGHELPKELRDEQLGDQNFQTFLEGRKREMKSKLERKK